MISLDLPSVLFAIPFESDTIEELWRQRLYRRKETRKLEVDISKAIDHHFPSPSYDQVYFEAFANAIDAGATQINIGISIECFEMPETLVLTISDNGCGFKERNFEKFSKLMDTDGPDHKGLGRLVYLAYFESVHVSSVFDAGRNREFDFTKRFDGKKKDCEIGEESQGTTLTFNGFIGQKLHKYDDIKPEAIKKSLLYEFLPLLFHYKNTKRQFNVNISLETNTPNPKHDFYSTSCSLSPGDVPDLEEHQLVGATVNLIDDITIYYQFSNELTENRQLRTYVCVDDRAIKYSLLKPDRIPHGHQAVFLFKSDFFLGRTDSSRRKFILPEDVDEIHLKETLRDSLGEIIRSNITVIDERNLDTRKDIHEKYPHLRGYISEKTVGLIDREQTLIEARDRFFDDQKEILECENLDDETYEKAINVASRVLMEYVLYRSRIIEKLESTSTEESEGDIHDILVPRRKVISSSDFETHYYSNNVWLLDDKYMSYSTTLSDVELTNTLQALRIDSDTEVGRPDITLVFSANPELNEKFDVVIIELKKHGVKLDAEERVVNQLRERARRILQYYPNKINRIWFYGVTDINEEFERSLREDGFKELYSQGKTYYKSQPILPYNQEEMLVDLYVINYESLIKDASARNDTFLNLLKHHVAELADDSI